MLLEDLIDCSAVKSTVVVEVIQGSIEFFQTELQLIELRRTAGDRFLVS